jgi:hypothetical protein
MPETVKPSSVLTSLKADFLLYFPNLPHLDRDFSYLVKRYDREGMIFLTITLSKLGREFDSALINGAFELPLGWRKKKGTQLPQLFYTLFGKVFNDDGKLRASSSESIPAAFLLRQVLSFWSKLESNNLEETSLVKDEFLIRITKPRELPDTINPVSDVICEAKRLLSLLFDASHPLCHELTRFRKNPWGRHGPGAVANREKAVDKWNFIKYPAIPSTLLSWRDGVQEFPTTHDEPSSRVICVPKDFRGPRVICIEPKEYQFAQQGLMDLLYELCSKHYLTRRSINFFDVSESRNLCFDYRYATIDLKDASDNLSLSLVKTLLPKWIYRTVIRYRTPLVDGTRSTCFATMGSALCFPIQTIVFWALAKATITCRGSVGTSFRAPNKVRVFGDDIIVPNSLALNVVRTLTACGMVVNHHKTCISSRVRESCGEWVFDRVSIRIIRLRNHRISSIVDWNRLIDYADEAEKLYLPCLSRLFRSYAFWLYLPRKRWGIRFQRAEVRVPVLIGRNSQQVAGYAGLYAWHVHSAINPPSRGSVRTKWRWVGAYSKVTP